MFPHEHLKQADTFLNRHPFMQWFVYAIPVFPLELMTFVIGLSNKSFKRFFFIAATALPFYAIIVTYVGSELAAQYKTIFDYASIGILIVMAAVIIHFIYAWNRENIHQAGHKLAKSVHAHVTDASSAVQRHMSSVNRAQKTERKRK